MNIVNRLVPAHSLYCFVPAKNRPRPVNGFCLHHTATTGPAAITPERQASWHYQVLKDGTIYQQLPDEWVAYHAGNTNRWRPSWVEDSPHGFSSINWSSCGIEIVYAPQFGEVPTTAQLTAVHTLITHKEAAYGRRLPAVGHGEIDDTKWLSEPHLFDWTRAGFGERTAAGRLVLGADMALVARLEARIRELTGERDHLNGIATDLQGQLQHCQDLKTQVEHDLTMQVADLQRQLAARPTGTPRRAVKVEPLGYAVTYDTGQEEVIPV